jgi:phage terminase large subunit-like protein
MPWQSYVNAVANELNEDGSFHYKTVIVSTPRQAGKTTLLSAIMAHRCIALPDFRIFYTSHSGTAARAIWGEWYQTLSASMPGRWRFRLSNGEESATWPSTHSFIKTFPPTPASLHGAQADLVALDEVWKYTMQTGDAITQAVVPTQATRPRRQLWIVSTAGNDESEWMRGKIEHGRASLTDPATTTAYFEWSAGDDMDPTDPATWPLFHPAYGITIDHEGMLTARDQMGEQFARAYGNQWPTTAVSWRAAWGLRATVERLPEKGRVHLSADSHPNHRAATIAACGDLVGGGRGVEIVDMRPGIDWVLPRLVDLSKRHRCPIVIHRTGALGHLIEDLQGAGVRVVVGSGTDYADAVARFTTAVVAGGVLHPDDPRLNMAVSAAVTRRSGGRDVWDRGEDVSPLLAAAWAHWDAASPGVKPRVVGTP